MSDTKHTPGIGRVGNCLYEIDATGARNLWSGYLHPNNGYGTSHVERALALFAAAPALLEALQGTKTVLELAAAGYGGKQHTYLETRMGSFVEVTSALERAVAAIAAATAPEKTK